MKVVAVIGIIVLAGLVLVVFVLRKLGLARKEIETIKNDTEYL